MVAEAPALIIFSKTFLIATENSTSALTHIMFLLVQTPPIFLPGKFPTWIVSCQRWLGGRSSVSLGPTPSTLCFWIVIVNAMEQASARPTLHLEQLRVLAGLIFLHSLCLQTTTCRCCHRLFYCAPSEMHSRSRFSRCVCYHYPGLEAWTLLVGVATVACCRSSSSGKEKRRWRFVVPLSSRSALVLQNSSMGSMGYRLCLIRLTCSHP
mgnify:FL=1